MAELHPTALRGVSARLRDDESGVSLVEALVAVLILAIALLALAATAANSTTSLRLSRDRQQATQMASAALEEVRARSYDALVLQDVASLPSTFSYDGVVAAEAVVADASGPVLHERTDGRFTTTTWVTWANSEQTLKRVTVTASWRDRGVREVTESTLVARAQRGLPAPNFLVTPDLQTEQLVSGAPVCFVHNLLNLGERDSYSFASGYVSGAGTFTPATYEVRTVDGVQRHGFKVKDASGTGAPWFAWASMDGTDFTEQTGDLRPDSAAPLDRRATAPLRFCYVRISEGSTTHQLTPSFLTRIYSAFDSNVFRDVRHQVSDTAFNTQRYLATGGSNQRSRMELTESAPIRTDAGADYDSGGTSGQAGLAFRPGNTSDRANWDYQPGSSRVEGTGELIFWLATDRTLAGLEPVGPVTLEVQARRRTSQTGNATTTAVSDVVSVTREPTELTSPWTRVSVSIPFTATDFDATDYFSLSMLSASTSAENVHVHFDVKRVTASIDERFESRLLMRVVPR